MKSDAVLSKVASKYYYDFKFIEGNVFEKFAAA